MIVKFNIVQVIRYNTATFVWVWLNADSMKKATTDDIYTGIQGCVHVQQLYKRCQQSPVNPYSTWPCDELLNLGYNVFCIHVFADVAQVGTDHVY